MSSRKHHRSHDSDDEQRRSHSKKSKSQKPPSISDDLRDQIKPITEEDYFEKATEFRLWLKEEKRKYFNELDSSDSRYYFKKFVKAWNRFELQEKYYKGLSSAQLASSDTTRYKWKFASKVDQYELDTIRDSVDTMTSRGVVKDESNKGRRRNVGPAMPTSPVIRQDRETAEERLEAERMRRKAESKNLRRKRDSYLDEVAPKETGREAMLEKRKATNAFHKRERSPDVELSEADLMGGDDFQSRLAAEKQREERRNTRKAEYQKRYAPPQDRVAEYKAKENATIEMFRKMAEEQKRRGGL
ncbi:hypothetical protein J3Q64DRAFT_1129543 [Phycomyces blakesleeanus]|uniref:Uncharacterized protein n=1 Tax=Phycomyces blakesleeanus TaxID=4837 RepID=A0ABR3AX81_PHYBL